MGEVYAAQNLRTGRQVAIKLLKPEAQRRESAVERFRREAQAAGMITSEHVTQVFDVEDDPQHGIAIVLELLQGESFLDLLRREGPLSFERLYRIVDETLVGLADAHAAGIVHRDLKPSNVFLETKDGRTRVKILDFGISKLPKHMTPQTLTEAGQSLGTFSYMPPEQIARAKSVDARADLYALGTVVFQALTAKLPYPAGNLAMLLQAKAQRDAPSLAETTGRAWDPRLEAFLARMLARDPAARFPTAAEALTAWGAMASPELAPPPPAVVHPAAPVHAADSMPADAVASRPSAASMRQWSLVAAVVAMALVTLAVFGALVARLVR